MCAARIEILSNEVRVKHKGVVVGKGPGVFELHNFDAEKDLHTRPNEAQGSLGLVLLDLGTEIGRALVSSQEHDTSINIKPAHASASVEMPVSPDGYSYKIQDEVYWGRKPSPVPIADSEGNVLAIVTHVSR